MFTASTILNEVKRYRAEADKCLAEAATLSSRRFSAERALRNTLIGKADEFVSGMRALMILLGRCSSDTEDHAAAKVARGLMFDALDEIDRLRGKPARQRPDIPGEVLDSLMGPGDKDYGEAMRAYHAKVDAEAASRRQD